MNKKIIIIFCQMHPDWVLNRTWSADKQTIVSYNTVVMYIEVRKLGFFAQNITQNLA